MEFLSSRARNLWLGSKESRYTAVPGVEGAPTEHSQRGVAYNYRKLGLIATAFLFAALAGYALFLNSNDKASTEHYDIIAPEFDSHSVSPPIRKSFAGFAFEERSFIFYAGPGGKPNSFSYNLVKEVANKTGTNSIVRVGGTSLDHSSYDANQQTAVKYAPGTEDQNVPRNMTFGPSYFDSFVNFPSVRYILTVGMAKDNLSNTLEFAKAGRDAVEKAAHLYSISVGNEPNLYAGRARPSGYSSKDWVKDFKKYTDALSNSLGFTEKPAMYDAEGLSAHKGKMRDIIPWHQRDIFHNGLNALTDRIKSVSMHYYQTLATKETNMQAELMNHTALVNGMKYFVQAIQFLRQKGIPLDLAEVGSALNRGGRNHEDLEGAFGAALWQADFMLHSMAIGVDRVNIQQGIGFGFSMWQPVDYKDIPAHVRAPYYAQVFAADFIGSSDKDFQVVEISMGQDLLAAYAGFEGGNLARIAVLNLRAWDSSSSKNRPIRRLSAKLPLSSGKVRVERLTSAKGARALRSPDMSWAGKSWTLESNGLGVQSVNDSTTLQIRHGAVHFNISASEAIVLYLLT